MSSIFQIIYDYTGTGLFFILYLVALGYLVWQEKDRGRQILMMLLPALVLIVFMIPPVYQLYSKLDGSDTYYRMLWLIPQTLTIAWAGVLMFRDNLRTGLIVLAGLIILSGDYVYDNENLLAAENRLHIPQMVLDVADYILNETDGERTVCAMPIALAQFTREYTSKIVMPFGRDMLMGNYYNPVYEALEQTDPVVAETLCESLDQYDCEYLVIEAAKVLEMDGDLEDYGLEFLAYVDGYNIYHCPYWDEYLELIEES